MKNIHWILIIIFSLANGMLIQSFDSVSLNSFGIAEILGTAMGLIGITFVVAAIPAFIYWLFKRKTMPGLNILVWVIWAIVAIMSALGNYNISKSRSVSVIESESHLHFYGEPA